MGLEARFPSHRLGGSELREFKRFLLKQPSWPPNDQKPGVLPSASNRPKGQLTRWQKFYREIFGFKSSELRRQFKNLVAPTSQTGFDRLVVVLKGLEPNQVFAVCQKRFPSWRWTDDLNEAIVHNDREPTKTYAIWLRDRVEADEENKHLSANNLKAQNHQGITLLERLVQELFYHWETGQHLDVQNNTLYLASSRHHLQPLRGRPGW